MYQTAKVAKVLLLLEKGKGGKFKWKSLNEIQFDSESSDEETDLPVSEKFLNRHATDEATSSVTQIINEEVTESTCKTDLAIGPRGIFNYQVIQK